ncbi:uncharacterized protein PHALS_10158 [Plasmopara halstedii]|uniref:Uncharacterized protein n=1 Tax=Plasmopara halstedii TaxID=4781 RepID=A0A0P1AGC3_PLAHL|nr:uncharacterized protein PHALS_10158 [Plasmopara halstedii]CEG39932.1 hypothetical protein PHALS_10158 [Plasmopara halstedii]|eukprot:XP_024576301.1 hypothetical protein PHALS_10158 [Plasmopara halstedii]
MPVCPNVPPRKECSSTDRKQYALVNFARGEFLPHIDWLLAQSCEAIKKAFSEQLS